MSAEAAARQAQAQTLRRIGRGGLNEEGGVDEGGEGGVVDPRHAGLDDGIGPLAGAGARRGDALVAETQVRPGRQIAYNQV